MLKLASPNETSSDHSRCHQPLDLGDSLIQLLLAFGTHQLREKCSHGKACPHIPETSRCTVFYSSLDTSDPIHTASRQTSTLRESFAQILFRIREQVLAQHGSLAPNDGLLPALCSLLTTPSLECRVEQHEDHTYIQFRADSHPKSLHSELILHHCSHSNSPNGVPYE